MTKEKIKGLLTLFLTAFVQVALVAANTIFISNHMVKSMLVTGFGISAIWCINVKRISIGNNLDKFSYAFGAMCGTGFGYYLSSTITEYFS